jgi:hypothetical protein
VFIRWLETQVRQRAERWIGLTDRRLDLEEREIEAREAFLGLTPPVVLPASIEDRLSDSAAKPNGRHKVKASS